MKDIAIKKKGFTLVELLAVIGLLSILAVFVVPEVYKYLQEGTNKALKLQEKNVEDAAKLYLEDYCISPINSNFNCPSQIQKNIENDFAIYSGKISLSTLIDNDYIDEIHFKNVSCASDEDDSYVMVTKNKLKAYLKCGEVESEGWTNEES